MPHHTPLAPLLVLTGFIALGLSAPVGADHSQPLPGGGAVTFDHIKGNEWWVEVDVTGSTPDAVYARDTHDPSWHRLTFRDWGVWAGSFHIEPGHEVMFRSVHGDREMTSCWFAHPGGTERCSAESDGFSAAFDTPGGNDWWVEVYVDANEPLAGVEARADDGSWRTLEHRDWGAWAASFHVPDGSLVTFRATATDGDRVRSDPYVWPSGDAAEPGEPGDDPPPTVAFGPKASNAWWVETYAIAPEPIDAVAARVDGGPWHSLERKDWGAWAASFHIPDGSTVTFRATGANGGTGTSSGFTWPDALPTSGGDAWPHEGAYAHYHLTWGVASEIHGDVDALFIHHDGAWQVLCEGTGQNGAPFFEHDHFAPPFGPTDTSVGDAVRVETIDGCHPGGYDLTVDGTESHDKRQDGDRVTVTAWTGEWVPDCRCDYKEAGWETDTGLVIGFADGMTSWSNGNLQDTDAPITDR